MKTKGSLPPIPMPLPHCIKQSTDVLLPKAPYMHVAAISAAHTALSLSP